MQVDKVTTQTLERDLQNILVREGLELIELRLFSSSGSVTVRLLTDYPQGGITLAECARINKMVVERLDENKIFGDDFTVEVNSPGMHRPLATSGDFMRVKGKAVGLWLRDDSLGKSYMEGEVVGVEDKTLTLKHKEEVITIPRELIKTAKQRIDL